MNNHTTNPPIEPNAENEQNQELNPKNRTNLWHEPVDGTSLFIELSGTFSRYLALQNHQAEALALWAIFSHSFNAFDIAPKLLINSPEKRCGKTTLLDVMSELVWKPLLASNITPAVIFRVIEDIGGTLVIDEADTFIGKSTELTGVINSGHRKKTAIVWRCDGDKNEPRSFSTWAPTILAMIGKPQDTIIDRSICITMRRKTDEEKVERFNRRKAEAELQVLARKIGRWCADNFEDLSQAEPTMPEGLHDRAEDNWRPLLAIADLLAPEYGIKAREAAIELNRKDTEEESVSAPILLLRDIHDVFALEEGNRITTDKLLRCLWDIEDHPWLDWNRGRPLTAAQVAKHLRPFGITPQKMRFGQTTIRGYERGEFEDAFARYLGGTLKQEEGSAVPSVPARPETPPASDTSRWDHRFDD